MNKEVKEKWVSALRSGRYTQIRTSLYRPGTNECCVMGVLCMVAEEEGIIDKISNTVYPTFDIVKWAGMGSAMGPELPVAEVQLAHEVNSEYLSAMDLNDTHGIPFWQLANMIEAFA